MIGSDELIVSLWIYPALAMIFVVVIAVCYKLISFFRGSRKVVGQKKDIV